MSFFEGVKRVLEKLVEEQQARKELFERLDSKSSRELVDIVKNDGFFGAPREEREMARKILIKRKNERSS